MDVESEKNWQIIGAQKLGENLDILKLEEGILFKLLRNLLVMKSCIIYEIRTGVSAAIPLNTFKNLYQWSRFFGYSLRLLNQMD